MADEVMKIPASIGDGFDDYGDDDYGDESRNRVIKGSKIKFTLDYKWVCGDEEISPDREFLVIKVLKLVQKWLPELTKPAETQVLAATDKFPDIDALNDKAPRKEWTEKFGKKVGPWQASMAVYLLDQQTMEMLTYINLTDNKGGTRAIRELRESTLMARKVQGAAVFPIVTLADTFMPTQFGGRQRPLFKIKCYVTIGEQAAPRQLEHTPDLSIEGEVVASKPRKPASRSRKTSKQNLEAQIATLEAQLEAEEEPDEDEALMELEAE